MNELKLRKLAFTGNDLFVGFDTHNKNWITTMIMEDKELATKPFEPAPDKFKKYIDKNYPNCKVHVAYEAGYCGYWIHDRFIELGIDCVVLNPADIPTTDKERKSKTDRSDSRKIARLLSSGFARGIYVPDVEMRAFRSLVRLRRTLVKDQTRIKNRIKSFLAFYGIIIPAELKKSRRCWSKKFRLWLKSLKFSEVELQITFDEFIKVLDFQIGEVKSITSQIRKLIKQGKYERIYKILRSVPGVGTITASVLLVEIIDIKRFESLDKLLGYIGLVPNRHSSGNRQHVGHITRRGNSYLKPMIIEASWIAMRRDKVLQEYFNDQKKRMKESKAIIKVAKKLVARIRYIWLHQTLYENLAA